jgi:hypothetical protein
MLCIQLSLWMGVLRLKPILGTTRPNRSSTTSRSAQEWSLSENEQRISAVSINWELNNYWFIFPLFHIPSIIFCHLLRFDGVIHPLLTIRIFIKTHLITLFTQFLHVMNNKLSFLLMLNFFTLVYLNVKVSTFGFKFCLNPRFGHFYQIHLFIFPLLGINCGRIKSPNARQLIYPTLGRENDVILYRIK